MRRLLAAVAGIGLVVATLVAVPPFVPSAAAAVTVIDFDNLKSGENVGTQYSSLGITFEATTAWQDPNPSFPRSRPNHIECYDPDGCLDGPIAATFAPNVARVAGYVGNSCCTGNGQRVTVRAFNGAGTEVGQDSVSFAPASTPIVIRSRFEISLPTNSIARITIDDATGFNQESIAADNIEFERLAPALQIDPNPADFGAVNVGSSAVRSIALRNVGTANLALRTITVAPGEFAKVAAAACNGATVPPGASCNVDVRFTPGAVTDYLGTITVTGNMQPNTQTGRLVGRGQQPGTETTAPATTGPTVPDSTSTTRTTAPPVSVPPTTPGLTVTVTPGIGPPGFVAVARGTGFPPGPVALAWAPGIGTFAAVAGPDGVFETQVLVFPRDRVGVRSIVATSGTVSGSAFFLVVPSSIQPSGSDVTQINRTRRFLQR